MLDIDLHGFTVREAEEIFHSKLNESRLQKRLIEVNFITGIGDIQARLKELAHEQDLYFYVPMHNRGCIVIEFE